MLRVFLIVVSAIWMSACAVEQRSVSVLHPSLTGAWFGAFTGSASAKFLYANSVTSSLSSGVLTGFFFGAAIDSDFVRMYRLNKAGVQIIRSGDIMTAILPSDHFFDIDSSRLRPESQFVLKEMAALIASVPNSPVSIMSFTDDLASEAYAEELTRKQSHRIQFFLWLCGLPENRLHALGCGRSLSIADHSVTGNALNRRVELSWCLHS